MKLDDWMTDAPEADWAGHLIRLAARGGLGRAHGRLFLDLPALGQPFACRPGECTPGRRDARTRSCCADLAVSLSADEQAAISQALPEISRFMARRDPRWASTPPLFDGDRLRRPGRRCVFAVDHPEGLRCGLHLLEDRTGRPRGALKPLPCRLFPLAVVDLGERRRLVTAVDRPTARLLGAPAARAFPCLRRDPTRPPLYLGSRVLLIELFGRRSWDEIRVAVRAWRQAARSRGTPAHTTSAR